MKLGLTNRATIWVLVATTLVFCALIVFAIRQKGQRITGASYNQYYKDTLQNAINNAPYHNMAPLSNSVVINSSSINEQQKQELISSLDKMLDAYSLGSVEAYLTFVTPKGFDWQYNKSLIAEFKKEGEIPQDATGDDLLKFLLSQYSNRTFYKGYFSGIVTSPDEIAGAIGATNEYHRRNQPGIEIIETNQVMLFNSMYVLTNYITLGVDRRFSIIHVSPEPDDVLRKHEKITYAIVYWLIKPGEQSEVKGACFPIFGAFYLNPDNNKWIPVALVRANVWKDLQYKARILF